MCQEEKHLGDSSARLGFLFRGYSLSTSQGAIPFVPLLGEPRRILDDFPRHLGEVGRAGHCERSVTNLGVNEGEPKLLQREYLQRANLPEKNILQGRERLKRSEKKQKFCGSTQAPLAAWRALLGHVFGVVQINCHQPFC